MGCFFVIIWLIMISIFPNHSLLVTISAIIAYILTYTLVDNIKVWKERQKENKKYRKLLQETMPKVQFIDISSFQKQVTQLEQYYERNYSSHKAILRNTKGEIMNICPKCGGNLGIRKTRMGKRFLGCANYPNCSFIQSFENIYEVNI